MRHPPPRKNRREGPETRDRRLPRPSSSTGAAAFWRKLAFSGLVNYAIRLALPAGIFKASDGCVILLTAEEFQFLCGEEDDELVRCLENAGG